MRDFRTPLCCTQESQEFRLVFGLGRRLGLGVGDGKKGEGDLRLLADVVRLVVGASASL